MNVHNFLTDPKRSYWFENILVKDPAMAYTYLKTSFIFDLVMFIGSMIGMFAIWVTKPESILYYIFVCTLFVYYLLNVFSVRTYISLFVSMFLFKFKLLDFYQQGSTEDREVIDRLIDTLPEEINVLYKESFAKLLKE